MRDRSEVILIYSRFFVPISLRIEYFIQEGN